MTPAMRQSNVTHPPSLQSISVTTFIRIQHCIFHKENTYIVDSTLLIENVDVIYISLFESNVTIVCNHSNARFEFNNVSAIYFSGLTFIGCTRNKFNNIDQFILKDSQFVGSKNIKGTVLELVETSTTFIRTKFSHNYGNIVTSLFCDASFKKSYYRTIIESRPDTSISEDITAGGAIVSTHSNITIIDSTFEGNSAQAGGAIFAELQSNISIINSTFVGNQATSLLSHQYCYGGGGVLYCDSGSYVMIQNSTFEHNRAQWLGGVIAIGLYVVHDNVTITIANSVFINNAAHYFGGVLSGADYLNITITDSEFTNNSANYSSRVLDLSDADYSSITINNSEFINNSAFDEIGGVMDLSGADHSIIAINNTIFTNNGANSRSRSGVLDMFNTKHSNVIISNCEFTNNSAKNGGMLNLVGTDNSVITITSSKFTGNSVLNTNGGVIFLSCAVNTSINITDSEFTSNSANSVGGVLSLSVTIHSIVTITNSEFTNNSANHDGGGVLSLEEDTHASITITSSVFTGNEAQDSRGGVIYAIYIRNITITISYSNFTNNSASEGGAVYCSELDDISLIFIIASWFVNNKAHSSGGVLSSESTNVSITQSNFLDNQANSKGGTMYISQGGVTINSTRFHLNTASVGGVLWAQQATIICHETGFSHNTAHIDGGVLYAAISTMIIVITQATFSHNRADNNGGTLYIMSRATTSLIDCKFNQNTAGNDGGVIRSYMSTINISNSEYSKNSANNEGGVFHIDQTSLAIEQTSFIDSKAKDGGVIWTDQGDLTINQSYFNNNNASAGGVIWAEQVTINASNINITHNSANVGVVFLLESNSDWSSIRYSGNVGTLYALGGTITLTNGNVADNVQPNDRHPLLKEGGTITAIQCEININGNYLLTKGHAERGGALKAIESKINVCGNVTVANNTATVAGGGIYLYQSELTIWKNSALNIWNNTATEKGGGINAIGSTIKVKNPYQSLLNLHFDSNQAMNGGGLFLEMDSKMYILKSKMKSVTSHQRLISFTLNSAQYGGAIYVSDNGICGVYTNSTLNECFIQTLAMYAPLPAESDPEDTRCQNIDFVNNTAEISGNSLFGGLLDRCSVSQFAEININNVNMDYTFSNGTMIVQGYEYFQKISNIHNTDIGSPPVRVCFCTSGRPNCPHQHEPIQVRKGQQSNISLSLAIVNQIYDPIQEPIILSNFHSGNYLCQNHIRSMDGSCSSVNFAVSSNNDTEELILSLDEGPCKDVPDSKARVTLEFYCPECLIGFELDESEEGCRCICDSQLFPYFTNCSQEILVRETNVWVTNLITNNTFNIHQYLIHPYCPLDYCHPPISRVEINLNTPNGADAQCANHRAGLLCGTCQNNFSLSLGSSHCLPCSTHWYAVLIVILIAAILAGIVLVALVLTLNLTVAIGTLNGIIFYANIVYANSSLFLPLTSPFGFIYVFISWVNLEIGFDTCFFVGMDAYSKTLLQLAFPGYVFFLVFMVIIISKHSTRFSQLIGKRNPVATLATLISLSYAKYLHISIASLSFATLKYPDGSQTFVWLVDASVGYLSGKHIALFIIALFIIIVGVCYTTLLLMWQWLLRHQDKTVLKWTKNQKLCHFIEPYHAPYVDKHRYWAGLLFLIRVVLYIIFALNVNGDPHVSLVAIILTIGGLLLMKGFLAKVYKKWPIDMMESIMYFNILGFAALTWYFIEIPQRQIAVVYTSVSITFLFLLMVIGFHVYKFTSLGSVIHMTKIFKVRAAKSQYNGRAGVINQNPIEPGHREYDVSFSVVEVPQPLLECPESDVHIQLKPLELPCYTPLNSLEQQDERS